MIRKIFIITIFIIIVLLIAPYLYAAAPVLTQIIPDAGSVTGGETVTINGQNFGLTTTVLIGSHLCTSLNVLSSTLLTAITPASSIEGEADVVLSNGPESNTYSGAFTYETYFDTFGILMESAKEGTSNIYIIGNNGTTYIARDPDINLTIGITEIVSQNYAIMPLINPLIRGQRIYIQDFLNGASSEIITIGSTIGPLLSGGLYEGDNYAKGLGGEASNGTTYRVLRLASGSNRDKIKVMSQGTLSSNMFSARLSSSLRSGDLLIPYISGIAGNIVTVGSDRGPTIKWPLNVNSTTIEGVGIPGEEVRLYDIGSLDTLISSTNVGTDGTYSITVDKSYTTQGNILSVMSYLDDSSMGKLGGIITVGANEGPRINNNTGTNQVVDGDTQVTGTGSSGQRVVIEKLSNRIILGSGIVGTDSNFTAALSNSLTSQSKIVSVQNNISGEIISVAGTGNVSIMGSYGNYPNPFDPNRENTTIEYTLNQNVNIVIYIYNINTIEVKTIECPATTEGGKSGLNRVLWDGKDGYGNGCSTGVYLYRIYNIDNRIVLGKGKIAIIRK